MECKNTEFVWKLRKTGFCESGHTQGCLLLRASIRRAFTVVSFDTPLSQQGFYIHLWFLHVHVYSQLIVLISFHMSNKQRLVSLSAVFVLLATGGALCDKTKTAERETQQRYALCKIHCEDLLTCDVRTLLSYFVQSQLILHSATKLEQSPILQNQSRDSKIPHFGESFLT